MRTHRAEIEQILRHEGIVSRRRHPELDSSVRLLVRRGELVRVLPGIFAPVLAAAAVRTRILALMAYDPDAILTDAAAASVSFWPEISCPTVTAAVRHRRQSQVGYCFTRRSIPPELIVDRAGLRFTSPALTALDLCGSVGGDAIDHALRRRRTTLPELRRALELTADRVGNPVRRRLLLDSCDEPWSAAERLLHQLLRGAGITGWQANRAIVLEGATYHPDALFHRLRLVVEVDGRTFHSDPEVFESDRWRQNLLVLDGWCVLRFTYAMLRERPQQVLGMIRQAIAMLEASVGSRISRQTGPRR